MLGGGVSQAEKRGGESPKATHAGELRPFTVADSIESTHFVQPEEHTSDPPPVSPDGKKFLVVTERGLLKSNLREFSLFVFAFNRLNEKPRRVAVFRTSSNRPGIAQARWVDNETISLIGENPSEFPQVYAINCRSRALRKLTTAEAGVAAYDVTHDLKIVAYYSHWVGDETDNKLKEEHGFAVTDEQLSDLVTGRWKKPDYYFQMFISNMQSGETRAVKMPPFAFPAIRLAIWLSPDGRYAVTEQDRTSAPDQWSMYESRLIKGRVLGESGRVHKRANVDLPQIMLVDTRTAKIQPLLDSPVARAPLAVWMPDSRSVVVAGTFLPLDVSDPRELKKREKEIAAVEVEIPDLTFHRVADVSDREWWTDLRLGSSPDTVIVNSLQQDDGGSWTRAPSQRYRREGVRWMQTTSRIEDSDSWIRISEANNRWPKLVKIDPVSKTEIVIFDPNPQFSALRFGREEIVRWTGTLGQPLVGGLLYPPDYVKAKKYPLVIQSYQLNENGFILDGPSTTAYAAQALVNHNVFVLQLSQSSLYQKTILTPDFGHTELSQIDSSVEYLDRLGLIDREKVGLVGFSMKGYQVMYALAHSKYHFAAATSAEGNDWSYWSYLVGGNSVGWAAQSEAPFGGPPWSGNWKSWMEESITFSFDKIHTPLRLESDSNDSAGVLNEWEKFVALTRLHRPVELIFISHGAHPVEKPWDRLTSQQGNVDWLMFWLKGEEDPDPAKAEQYARWQKLKKLQQSEAMPESNVVSR